MSSLGKFWRLTAAEKRDLATAVGLLILVRLGLWLLPFRVLFRLVYRRQATATASGERSPAARRAAWAIQTASRYVPGTHSCLPRALAAHLLLRQRGIPARLQVGVAPGENGQLAAHAWVEDQQGVLVGNLPDLARFVPLPLPDKSTR